MHLLEVSHVALHHLHQFYTTCTHFIPSHTTGWLCESGNCCQRREMMARAHASRIYAKFAVHTRQEFNEVLDGCLPPPPPGEPPEG